jgi:hypothetical protein
MFTLSALDGSSRRLGKGIKEMNVRVLPCLLIGALLMSTMGCHESKPAVAAGSAASKAGSGGGNLLPAQALRTVGTTINTAKDFQKLVAAYEADLNQLSIRIEASAADRWYVSAHKFVMNQKIDYDLKMVANDVDTLTKADLPASKAAARLHGMMPGLQKDTDRLAASVQGYMAQTTQAANDQALPAVRQNVEKSRKELLTLKKLSKNPATTTAKI